MKRISKLATHTLLYGIHSVGGRIIQYLLTPFFTSVFAAENYGIFTEFYAYVAFLNLLYTYGMETTFLRFASKKGADKEKVFNTVQSLLLSTTMVLTAVLVSLATPLVNLMGHVGCERYIYCFAVILATDTLLAIPLAELRLKGRSALFSSIGLFRALFFVGLNIFFLYFLSHAYEGTRFTALKPLADKIYNPQFKPGYVFLANLIANASVVLIMVPSLKKFRFIWPSKSIKTLLNYSMPLLWMGVAGTINDMLSRTVLKYLLPLGLYPGKTSEAVLGIFSACYRLGIFMSLAVQAFRYAADPFFFHHVEDENAPKTFSDVMYWFVIAGCFIVFSVSMQLDFLGYLFLKRAEYKEAIDIVPYLLLSYLLFGIYYNLSIWFKITDNTRFGLYITSLGAAITTLLNVVLIPYWGYWGCIAASLVSYCTMCGVSYFLGKKYYPIPYQVIKSLLYLATTMTLVIFLRQIHYTSVWKSMLVNGGFSLIFAFSIFLIERKRWGLDLYTF